MIGWTFHPQISEADKYFAANDSSELSLWCYAIEMKTSECPFVGK